MLRAAVDVASERDADLRRAVEDAVGRIDRARYVVRQGFLVEQTILDDHLDCEVITVDA
jgi:hypothetical protein